LRLKLTKNRRLQFLHAVSHLALSKSSFRVRPDYVLSSLFCLTVILRCCQCFHHRMPFIGTENAVLLHSERIKCQRFLVLWSIKFV